MKSLVSWQVGCCFLALLLGQKPSDGDRVQQRQQEPIRVEVEAVNVMVAVHDKKTGNAVTNLEAGDFRIIEEGVLQQITNFSRETDLPLTIALCIDTSASVKLKLGFEKDAATDFLYSVMRPTDRTLLVEFDTGVTLVHDFTSNPNDIAREIKNLKAGGGTSMYDAIYLVSEQKMLEERGRKTVVILTDGADLTSKRTYEEALEMAHRAEVTLYAISTTRFGANIDHEGENVMKQLAESTGGRSFFPYSTKQLVSAFQQINEDLRSQYNLAYMPINKTRDGKFRRLEVRVLRDHVNIRHRKGYFAPRPVADR